MFHIIKLIANVHLKKKNFFSLKAAQKQVVDQILAPGPLFANL